MPRRQEFRCCSRAGACLLLGLGAPAWADPAEGGEDALVAVDTEQPAASSVAPLDGFLDFNAYGDTRGFANYTINALANLPGRFQHFSLVNYSNDAEPQHIAGLTGFYSEQHLRWQVARDAPIDLTGQWVIMSGESNDLVRFGVRWLPSATSGLKQAFDTLHLFYFVNLHPLQLDYLDAPGWRGLQPIKSRVALCPPVPGVGFEGERCWSKPAH